jgi:hypothetical protein
VGRLERGRAAAPGRRRLADRLVVTGVGMDDRRRLGVACRRPRPPRQAGPLRGPLAGHGRAGRPLTGVLLAAARAGEPDLQEFAATIDRERLAGASALAGHLAESGALAPGLSVERARDLIWLHTAPDTYRLLVLERGWPLDEFERWSAASLAAALLPGPA